MTTQRLASLLRLKWFVFVVATVLQACGGKTEGFAATASSGTKAAGALGGAPGGAAIAVSTVAAQQRDFDVTLETMGTVTPLSSVDIKPQISSVVTRVHVKEGQFVKAGELLFTLDARADQANVAKVRAQMQRDAALLADAQRQLARSRDLLDKGFVSQGALDSNQTQVDSQLANLAANRAALEAAQLALSYSSVRAPGAGRLGAINVYPGSAVQANQTSLVTVTQLDPINISFTVPQRYLDVVLKGLKAGGSVVRARLGEAGLERKGALQFVDSAVDAATGMVKVRARFANQDASLWPGAFVKVTLLSATLPRAVVLPAATLVQTSQGTLVYVSDKGKAARRSVKVLAFQGDAVAVEGVAAGERVVLEGRQNVRPDAALLERAPVANTAPAPVPAGAASSAP
ncbi:MAG: efflux RND transporter periplasmic adaptor subunit [Burkholderiales bacterium]|nr:efflux RND transporter periplasmic adaptor subunit [Burkholderiales bacterium]